MERVILAGVSLTEASLRIKQMAKMLHDELLKGEVALVLTNQGSLSLFLVPSMFTLLAKRATPVDET